jgi:hypothetical protein
MMPCILSSTGPKSKISSPILQKLFCCKDTKLFLNYIILISSQALRKNKYPLHRSAMPLGLSKKPCEEDYFFLFSIKSLQTSKKLLIFAAKFISYDY